MPLLVVYLPESAVTAEEIDGVDHRPPIVDSAGHLQVDIIGSLPAGSAVLGAVKLDSYDWTPVHKAANYAAAQTDAVVWTPATGKQIVLLGVLLTTDTAMTIQIESSDVDVIPPCYFAANGGAVISGGGPIWEGAANATLTITSSAAGNHSVLLWGYEK